MKHIAYLLVTVATATLVMAQVGIVPRAGGPISGVDPAAFATSRDVFSEVEAVPDGLGPRFNLDQCSGCHIHPAVGGSSPAINPQIAVATLNGATNTIPSFISRHSPIREARFIRNPDGTPDGGVHALFVISGRTDAPGCNIKQPDFVQAQVNRNIIFRIPTPLFGLGYVEGTPDNNLRGAFEAQSKAPGIKGRFNTTGNDGTITRFGWKAQNKSLLLFAGEAYNVEMGITNEIFPNEREEVPQCQFNALPENITDIVTFADFMRALAPAQPAPATLTTTQGKKVFAKIGCDGCHIPTQITGRLSISNAADVVYHPYSDFAVHQMGEGLADHVAQGNAAGDEFRTAPLWGLGQRLFFLHDGRTKDLTVAIRAHASKGSEANGVVANFNRLNAKEKYQLLNFLGSL